jgi:hypothetical protein
MAFFSADCRRALAGNPGSTAASAPARAALQSAVDPVDGPGALEGVDVPADRHFGDSELFGELGHAHRRAALEGGDDRGMAFGSEHFPSRSCPNKNEQFQTYPKPARDGSVSAVLLCSERPLFRGPLCRGPL